MRQYEAMFLFDPTVGAAFEQCEAEVRRLMERAGGEIILCRKWDERRLAFRVKGRKRGVYVLVYFKAEVEKIVGLERDAKLSESILRLLVLRAEGVTPELMERAFTLRADDSAGDRGWNDRPSRPGRGRSEGRSDSRPSGRPATSSPPASKPAADQPAESKPAESTKPAEAGGDTGTAVAEPPTEAKPVAEPPTDAAPAVE